MKRILIVLTVFLLVAGFVSLTVNDRPLLNDLRYGGPFWHRTSEASDHPAFADEPDAYASADSFAQDLQESVQIGGEYQLIHYEGTNAELHIFTEDREDFDIRYEVTDGKGALAVDAVGGTLHIREKNEGLNLTTQYLVHIVMPERYANDILVNLVNGAIYSDPLTNGIRLETVNADISLGVAKAVPVAVKTVNGSISIGYDPAAMKDLHYRINVTNGIITFPDEETAGFAGSGKMEGTLGSGTIDLTIESVNGIISVHEQ